MTFIDKLNERMEEHDLDGMEDTMNDACIACAMKNGNYDCNVCAKYIAYKKRMITLVYEGDPRLKTVLAKAGAP